MNPVDGKNWKYRERAASVSQRKGAKRDKKTAREGEKGSLGHRKKESGSGG